MKGHQEVTQIRAPCFYALKLAAGAFLQEKRTCYAQTSQIRQIRQKMVEIMTREASSCDLKELVGKFIPEAIGESDVRLQSYISGCSYSGLALVGMGLSAG